ncbi:ankyrin repeat-containing protein BDA1-like [Cornus florida]|uniref:ankyrin repeat-containing protein BDA1-like n=1 Tax=Cornus florida TaxID=4283 RepID=UPI00289DB4BC|nr:ankyrin repeat-containing protein BDA1-like [Cornus florida]
MDPQLIQRLNVAAQDGSIEELYAVIGEDPDVLEEIDKKQFVQTPLHIAASAGRAHFAIEIMSLRPSFGRKLNPSGQSPLHLAVPLGLAGPLTQAQDETEKRQTETAIRLINIDNELIRVQGKERVTPLHYAAVRNKFHLVAEFLCACPLSIEDLTIRAETALHVAARNDSLETVKLISGCHGQSCGDRIIDWMLNSPLPWVRGLTHNGVVKLLIRRNSVYMNDKNLEGKTALDLGDGHQEVKAILVRAGASSGASNSRRTSGSLADYMSRGRVARILPSNLSGEMGNVILVLGLNNHSGMETKIMVWNSMAFFTSIAVISFTLPTITDKNQFSLGTTLVNVTNLLQLCLHVLTSTYLVLVVSLGDSLATSACLAMLMFFLVPVNLNFAVHTVELKKFSAIPVSRGNPSRFFEMRRQMVGL